MVNGQRTPRKEKVWADRFPGESQVSATVQQSDLLSGYKSDIDLSLTRGITIMRIIGRAQTVEDGVASTPIHGRVQLGIAWAPQDMSAQYVDIFDDGVREMQWMWRDTIEFAEASSVVTGRGCATVPAERNNISFDITQMRKQPTPRHKLFLFWGAPASGIEETTVNLRFHAQLLIALP